ncbi:hypothetical protein [Leucobacter aridicollis]|uniref:hypothetical protein n=1 Tax=Leucobacter aridicollis TaxID=283878 RepID=UPI002166C709|nr:hypothetical protein [Leucobacter aridicollis]MCS3429038.1 hypothetical protein [Leucobacter aridicollis]
MEWKYRVPEDQLSATGYEETRAEWAAIRHAYLTAEATEDARAPHLQEALELVQRIGVFPITHYSKLGAELEVQQCREHGLAEDTQTAPYGVKSSLSRAGADLCHFMFPNLFDIRGIKVDNSYLQKFETPELIRKALPNALAKPSGLSLTDLKGQQPHATNFYPMAAQHIFTTYAPEGGVVWDPSCGFGGRLLGALTSRKHLTYLGTDPAKETIHNLKRLGQLIEDVTGRTRSYELHAKGSEKDIGLRNEVDFAFTSPPYFSLEWYATTDKTQGLEKWFEKYVRGTIRNIYRALKPGARYAVNLADFEDRGQEVNFVDRWAQISFEEGFRFISLHGLDITARANTKLREKRNNSSRRIATLNAGVRQEPILHFYKP